METVRVTHETIKRFLHDPMGTALLVLPSPKKVIFNPPATVILWGDGTKTVVKCCNLDEWDPEKGLAMAFMKKLFGNSASYHQIFKEFCPDEELSDLFDDDYTAVGGTIEGLNMTFRNIFGGNR